MNSPQQTGYQSAVEIVELSERKGTEEDEVASVNWQSYGASCFEMPAV